MKFVENSQEARGGKYAQVANMGERLVRLRCDETLSAGTVSLHKDVVEGEQLHG